MAETFFNNLKIYIKKFITHYFQTKDNKNRILFSQIIGFLFQKVTERYFSNWKSINKKYLTKYYLFKYFILIWLIF